MVKSKLLTPVLAGVLGVSIAGSALGYVLVNKDSDSKSGKKYHTKSCRYTGKSSQKVTRAKAQEMGKKPCNTCHPDAE